MPKAPAMQFYVGDWLSDDAVGACSPATRGIWIDMLAHMWRSADRGVLAEKTPASLARLCRCTADEMATAIDELNEAKTAIVTKCNGKITVSSRRMVREEKFRKDNALRQQRHRKKADHGESNGEVTSPSSSSPSSSPSTEEETTPAKTKKFDPSVAMTEAIAERTDFLIEPFLSAWASWCEHRKEKGTALKKTATKMQIKMLLGLGPARAISALEHSTRNAYTGLFEPKDGSNGNGRANGTGHGQPSQSIGTGPGQTGHVDSF